MHKKIIVILLILILAVLGVFLFISLSQVSGYDDEKSFNKFADKYFKSIKGDKEVGTLDESQSYNTPFSSAKQLPKMNLPPSNEALNENLKEKINSFEKNNSAADDSYKLAFLAGYESYKTPEKVHGVAIYHLERVEKGKDDVSTKEYVKTYNFSTKSGFQISSPQIFKSGYDKLYEKNIKSALEEEYGGKLKENYSKKIGYGKDNFIMTDKGFKYFFDSGSMLPKDKSVCSVEIPYSTFKGVMQEDIGKRVIDPNKPMLAITYDDGPDATYTPQLLDILEKNDSVATFFELGSNVDNTKNADKLLRRELDLGCEIGTHSYNHPNHLTLKKGEIKKQAKRSICAIEKASGQKPTVFRPPYGSGNDEVAKIYDLPSFNWNVDTMDWSSKNKDVIANHVANIPNLDGSIILMHSIHKPTIEASEKIIPELIDRGYQLVTITELMQYKYGISPIESKHYGYNFDK